MRMRTRLLTAVLVAGLCLAGTPAVAVQPGSAPAADSGNPGSWTATTITPENVARAVAQLPAIVADVQARTGVPGIALAVVYQDTVVTSAGFGVRAAGQPAAVDADTVFQMASVSKPVAATAVSRAVSRGTVGWDDEIRDYLPRFALDDGYVTRKVTIADLFSHRSGLPEHAGDDLEDIGYGRAEVLRRLRFLPLTSFRDTYAYTNFGLTAAAEAVARAAGSSWEGFAEKELLEPAGMTSSSYRFSDYAAATNKALTHVQVNGTWQHTETRDPQAQSPAGGLSSTANDMARWLRLQLADGTLDGTQLIKPGVLQVMRSPHAISGTSPDPAARPGLYGYGINTGVDGTGHVRWSHSGAFALGTGTVVSMIPAADLGIVVLGNARATGQVETVAESFMDIAQTGVVQRDWLTAFARVFDPLYVNTSVLAGRTPPAGAKPARPLSAYVGTYANDYVGIAHVVRAGSGLRLELGPKPMSFALTPWGGNRFSYLPTGENSNGISAVTISPSAGTLFIEHLDDNGLGTLTRQP